jgi:hypothetical protein
LKVKTPRPFFEQSFTLIFKINLEMIIDMYFEFLTAHL